MNFILRASHEGVFFNYRCKFCRRYQAGIPIHRNRFQILGHGRLSYIHSYSSDQGTRHTCPLLKCINDFRLRKSYIQNPLTFKFFFMVKADQNTFSYIRAARKILSFTNSSIISHINIHMYARVINILNLLNIHVLTIFLYVYLHSPHCVNL